MTLPSGQTRTYERSKSVVFFRTKEVFGGLSNMASGFPLRVNSVRIHTSEALYQACRFPHMPDVQRKIIAEHSPMTAKMKSKPYRKQSRPDWDAVRAKIMRWCLRVKLAQNFKSFGDLLLSTGDRPIVEQSRKDDFWGAKEAEDGTLVGMNVLGRLLMELRAELKSGQDAEMKVVRPLPIPDFLLYGRPIEPICDDRISAASQTAIRASEPSTMRRRGAQQSSLFSHVGARSSPERGLPHDNGANSAIATLQPYPSYRPTELSWLGEIPVHWKVRRLKYVLRERDARSIDGKQQLLRVSQYTGVTKRTSADSLDTNITRARSLIGYKVVQPQELVVNIMLAWNGSMGVSRFPGIASPAYCVYRFKNEVVPWYFHHLLRSPSFKARIKIASRGVVDSRLRLYTDDLYRIEALLPPADEQAGIVIFLDHAMRRIDKTIHAKQRMIALLYEQREAIADRIVSSGVDPGVVRKESEIPSLGQIPSHWQAAPLKSMSTIQSGITLGKTYFGERLDEYPYLRVANVQAGRLNLGIVKTISLPRSEAQRSLLRAGDVLMTEGGDPDKLGRGCVWNGEIDPCLHQNHVFAVRPNAKRLRPQFLSMLLRTQYAKMYFLRTAKQTTNLASTNKTTIGRFRVLLPSVDEQDYLLNAIEKESGPISITIDKTENEIELLREYRTRLIADVVTGKLDVREAARKLPDEDYAEEPILADEEPETDLEESAIAGAAYD